MQICENILNPTIFAKPTWAKLQVKIFLSVVVDLFYLYLTDTFAESNLGTLLVRGILIQVVQLGCTTPNGLATAT